MTTTAGCVASTVARIFRAEFRPATAPGCHQCPERRERSATCAPLSSPVTYSAGRPARCRGVHGLQQQGGFANARVAADQHHAAFHDAAAQHAVQLVDAAGVRATSCASMAARGITGCALARPAQPCGRSGGFARPGLGHLLDQGVPGAAGRAFAQPARAGAAAFGTGKRGFVFGHGDRKGPRCKGSRL